LRVAISDEELNRCINLLNRKLYLTIFSFINAETAKKGNYMNSEGKVLYYEDLSADIRDIVLSLGKGETSSPIKTDDKYIAIRIDKIEKSPAGRPSEAEREKIKKILIEERKEKLINEWIAELREKASIKIMTNRGK
jgi:hypothetical protein